MYSYYKPYSKQDKEIYLNLCSQLRNIRKNLNESNKREFILLSIRIHSMRGLVPKSWYKLANK